MKYIIHFSLCLVLASCSFFKQESVGRKEGSGLSQEYAMLRSQNIDKVTYDLSFDLTNDKLYRGQTKIKFILKNQIPLSVDFAQGMIDTVYVNGQIIKHEPYNGHFINIPNEALKLGQNLIDIKYSHEYSKNGAGFYRYIDVEDNKTYIYSHFEPYSANQLFPCFDQPDLKATYKTFVKAPKNWEVISSTRETEKTISGEMAEWTFPETAKFSTYTYSLHAGDYYVWESMAKTKKHEIPLRLFARQSLAKYVKADEWFELTQQAFPYFEDFYGYTYPYVKYDQLIVPDFNAGAMENVAAVTFNEDRFVKRGEKTRSQRRRLASTLFHEMAHMWFGNLVTMKWWDDLWLNESFATYSATRALVDVSEFKESWLTFNIYKQSAYKADQAVTTHPITTEVKTTDEAFANFDSITYGKGASVLKQLAYFIGDKNYKQGLRTYFKRHAEGNTVLSDFMEAMESASKKDMSQWRERWLETAMVNSLEANYKCEKGRITHFELYQTATKDYPVLRPHKTKVAFFRKSGNRIKRNMILEVDYSNESTPVKKAIGKLCPDIVYPNYGDYDYVKVILDQRSIANIKEGLSHIDDEFLRSLLWSELWQMVRDRKLSVATYLEVVEFQGLSEKNLNTLGSILRNTAISLKAYFPESSQEWKTKKQQWVKFFETAFMNKIEESGEDVDRQKLWFNSLVSLSESPEVHDQLSLMLKAPKKSKISLSFPVDQDLRWNILYKVASYDHKDTSSLLSYEKNRDPSKRGTLNALYVESVEPRKEVKEQMLRRVVNGSKKESLGQLRAIMGGMFPENQKDLHRQFSDRYYEMLKTVIKKEDRYMMSAFTRSLVPTLCDQESSAKLQDFMKAEKLPFSVLKSLKRAHEENDRCIGIRALIKETSTTKTL